MFTSLDRISQNANDTGTRNDRCPLAEVLGQVMGSVERLWPDSNPRRPAWENGQCFVFSNITAHGVDSGYRNRQQNSIPFLLVS